MNKPVKQSILLTIPATDLHRLDALAGEIDAIYPEGKRGWRPSALHLLLDIIDRAKEAGISVSSLATGNYTFQKIIHKKEGKQNVR